MKLVVLSVGRARGPVAAAVEAYEERVRRYWKLEVAEVAEGAPGSGASPERVREAEGERILARLPDEGEIWALTREGKGITSRGLARYLEGLAVASRPGISFVLGGAHGLARGVRSRACRRLSLSPMTLPHDLARLLLLEQLYRAGTIRRGEPYHKGP